MRQLIDNAHMLWKRVLSYRKREWGLADYPVRMRLQKDVPDENRYWGRVLGWNIDGLGRSREAALKELHNSYQARKEHLKAEGKPVPRPGTKVPIEFASQDRVSRHPEILHDFIERVLGLSWALITDESSLWHFRSEPTMTELQNRIREVYGVEVSDIESGNIAEILERIAAARGDEWAANSGLD